MDDTKVLTFLDAHRVDTVERLQEGVRIPSVAGVPERKHNLERSARWLAAELRDVGFPTTAVWPGAERPAVHLWGGDVTDALRKWVEEQIGDRFDYQLTISQEAAHWHDSDESVRVYLVTTGAATLAYLWSDPAA